MRFPALLLSVSFAFSACGVPIEAPADLQDAHVKLLRGFDELDDKTLQVYFEAIDEQLDAVDLSGSLDGRTFALAPFDPTGVDFTYPTGQDITRQAPVLVAGLSTHDFATNVHSAMLTNQVCIESKSTVSYDRTYTEGDADCLLAGDCDVVRTTNAIYKNLSGIAKGWYDLHKDYRIVTLSDGRKAMVTRGWADRVYCGDKGTNKFAQTYLVETWIEGHDHKSTRRTYATWLEIDIGLPPAQLGGIIKNSLDEDFSFGDAYADNDGKTDAYCPNDPEKVYERPEGDSCKG